MITQIAHFLDRDDDGHWYIIPEHMEDRWFRWLRAVEMDEASQFPPEGVERINGWPGRVRFKEYRIDDL